MEREASGETVDEPHDVARLAADRLSWLRSASRTSCNAETSAQATNDWDQRTLDRGERRGQSFSS